MSSDDDNQLLNRLKHIQRVDFVNRYNLPLSIITHPDHFHIAYRKSMFDAEIIDSFGDSLGGLQAACKMMDRIRKCYKCLELFQSEDITCTHCLPCALKLAVYRNSRPDELEDCRICADMMPQEDMVTTMCCQQNCCKYCYDALSSGKCPYCSSDIW